MAPKIIPNETFPLEVSNAMVAVIFLVKWSIEPPTIAAAPYSPMAMILAQIVITFPIMITLIIKNIETDYPIYKEELLSYGASKKDIIFLLISNKLNLHHRDFSGVWKSHQ